MARPLSDLQWQIVRMFGELNVALKPAAVSLELGRKVKRTGRVMLKEYKLTNSQRVTIHRSLRSLVARGLAEQDEHGCYKLTDAGLAAADAQYPGLAELRATKTAEWEHFLEGMREVANVFRSISGNVSR